MTPTEIPLYRYFARYREQLIPLIGPEASAVVVSYYKGVLALLLFTALMPLLALTASPGTSTLGLLAVALSFVIACCFGVRVVRLSSRGGKLVSAYLTKEWRRPARIAETKVSLKWWRWRIAQERERSKREPSLTDSDH